MQRDASAAGAMGIDQRIYGAINFRLRQRVDDDLALPRLIRRRLPMLDRAAATAGEIGAEWIDALGAWLRDPGEAAFAVADFRLDDLAWQREGDIDRRTIGADAIAAMADMIDRNVFSHVAHP